MGLFRLGCDSPPFRFLQTSSCQLCPSKGTGREDASLQKLLDLQRWPRHRLGGCSPTRTDDPRQRGRAAYPVDLFRLLYRLGVDDDCPIRLSAAKALGVEPPLGVTSSIDPPCGLLADDTQRAARATGVDFLEPRRGRRGVCRFCRIGSLPLPRELPYKVQRKRLVIGFQSLFLALLFWQHSKGSGTGFTHVSFPEPFHGNSSQSGQFTGHGWMKLDGEWFAQAFPCRCSCFAPSAHSSPENLLALHAYYHFPKPAPVEPHTEDSISSFSIPWMETRTPTPSG